jgi:hypothetical protein
MSGAEVQLMSYATAGSSIRRARAPPPRLSPLAPSQIRYAPQDRSSCGYWALNVRGPTPTLRTHALVFATNLGELMPKPPNYKQDKKRREEAQKRRNEQEQQRKAERKNKGFPPAPGQ